METIQSVMFDVQVSSFSHLSAYISNIINSLRSKLFRTGALNMAGKWSVSDCLRLPQLFFHFFFKFEIKISLGFPAVPCARSVAQASLELVILLPHLSEYLGLQVWPSHTQVNILFLLTMGQVFSWSPQCRTGEWPWGAVPVWPKSRHTVGAAVSRWAPLSLTPATGTNLAETYINHRERTQISQGPGKSL